MFNVNLMAKTITIREVVYNDLIKVKSKDESFSELFERLIKPAGPRDVLSKIRGSLEFKSKKKLVSEIYAKRAEVRA
jgi:predicted CopG family antitoxin